MRRAFTEKREIGAGILRGEGGWSGEGQGQGRGEWRMESGFGKWCGGGGGACMVFREDLEKVDGS